MNMKLFLFGACAGVIALDLCAVTTVKRLTGTGYPNDPAGQSSLTNGYFWANGADWTDGTGVDGTGWQQPPVNDDILYLVSGSTIRPPRFDYTFLGSTIQIGDASGTASFGIGNPSKDSILTIGENGTGKLIFRRGTLGNFYSNQATVRADIEITAPKPASGDPVFYVSANNTTTRPKAALLFTGKVTGAENTMIRHYLYNYSPTYDNVGATYNVFRYAGDLSACHSTLLFMPWSNMGKHAWPDTRRASFSVCETTVGPMPGRVEIWRGAGLELADANTQFSLAQLELTGDNLLEFFYDFGSKKGGTLTVTDQLTIGEDGPIIINVSKFGGTDSGEDMDWTLIRAPEGTDLDSKKFQFTGVLSTSPYFYQLRNETEDGYSVLKVVHTKKLVAELYQTDGNNEKRQSWAAETGFTSSWRTNGVNAANNYYPKAGVDYVVDGFLLRTANTQNGVFAGDSLTLLNNSSLTPRFTTSMMINHLRILPQARNVMISHYGGTSVRPTGMPTFTDKAGTTSAGVMTLKGDDVRVQVSAGGMFYYNMQGRGICDDWDLYGTIDGRYCFQSGRENETKYPNGNYWLVKPHPNLRVNQVQLCYNATSLQTSAYDPECPKVPCYKYGTHVYLEDIKCLGVPPSKFKFDWLAIGNYSIFHPMTDMEIAGNGGISLTNMNKNVSSVGQFEVPAGVTLTINVPVNYSLANAEFRKIGEGTVVFGEASKPTFHADQRENPDTTGSNNLMRVISGAIKPVSSNCVDGLQVSFADAAKLVLDAHPANKATAKYGLYNEIYRSSRTDRTGSSVYPGQPLYLEAGATKLNVEIQDASQTPKPPKKLGLVTVGAEYKENVAAFLKEENIVHPYEGYDMKLVAEEFDSPVHGGKLVTFSAKFSRGFVFLLK